MSIDCADVCEIDWMYIRYDDPKKQAIFNGILTACTLLTSNTQDGGQDGVSVQVGEKNNSALGCQCKTNIG